MAYLFSFLVIALMVFALVDIIRRDDSEVKHLPKVMWVIIVLIVPLIGCGLWFALGREYSSAGIRMPRPAPRANPAVAPPPVRRDTRTTEQQLADLEREIEEDRLRAELERRRRDKGEA